MSHGGGRPNLLLNGAPEKIVFFTTGMSTGGAERVLATLADDFASRGCHVVIAMLKGDKSEYDLAPGVELRSARLKPGLHNLPRAISYYRQLIKDESPGVVVSFSTKSDLIALASRVLFSTRVKVVVSDRADPYTRARHLQGACNVLYRWSDAVVCQSRKVATYYEKRLGRTNIVVIPNPLNPSAIGEVHVGQRAHTIIAAGRLSEQKNHRLAIQAFKAISEEAAQLVLKIYGAGPLEEALNEFIGELGLKGKVSLEGVVTDVIRQNSDAALMLFTSSYEGYPNALLEAAATGIPIVTTDFSPGTAAEIVAHGVNGYVVRSHDPVEVGFAVLKAASGGLQPEELAANARVLRERHRTDRVVDAWLSLLRRC